MPLVRLNPTLLALHGRIGDRVYKTYGDGRVIVTRVARFDGYVPSAAQRARRDRMRAATAYAQRVYADPAAKALYLAAARALGRCAFRLAISDHLAGRVLVPDAAIVSPPITPRGRDVSPRRPPHRPTTNPPPQITPKAQIRPSAPAAVGRGRRTPPGLALPRIAPMIADPNPPSTRPPPAGRDASPRRPPHRARSVFIRGDPRHLRTRSTNPPANIANPRGCEPAQVRFRCLGLPSAPPACRRRSTPTSPAPPPSFAVRPKPLRAKGSATARVSIGVEATGKLRL